MKILLVEDHMDSSLVISRMLKLQGYSVEVAASCQEAIRAFEAQRFELIIVEICLPDGDGCDLLLEMIRMYPVKSIAISGSGMYGQFKRVKRAGFDRFLLKPIGANQFYSAITELFPDPEQNRLN